MGEWKGAPLLAPVAISCITPLPTASTRRTTLPPVALLLHLVQPHIHTTPLPHLPLLPQLHPQLPLPTYRRLTPPVRPIQPPPPVRRLRQSKIRYKFRYLLKYLKTRCFQIERLKLIISKQDNINLFSLFSIIGKEFTVL